MSETRILIRLLRIYFPRISEFGSALEFRGVGGGLNPPNPPRHATDSRQGKAITGQALRVPEGWGSQISRQSAYEGGKDVSPTHRPPLPPPPPRKYSWYSLLLEVESTSGPGEYHDIIKMHLRSTDFNVWITFRWLRTQHNGLLLSNRYSGHRTFEHYR
jgi:hypothetical protein